MAKLSLIPNPTFNAKVDIPLPGGQTSEVLFTFKHRTRDALAEWVKVDQKDVDAIIDAATGWDLTDEFNAKNVEKLCQNYMGTLTAFMKTYIGELTGLTKGGHA